MENDPHAYIVNAKVYDVKPENYSSEKFYVFIGSGDLDPMVLDTTAEINSILDSYNRPRVNTDITIKKAVKSLPKEILDKIRDVPIDFYKDFKDNLIPSIQDIAGESVSGEGKLFNNRELFKKALIEEDTPAFIKDSFTISTKLETRPQDFINPEWKPKQPEKLRFMHIDQGITSDHYGVSSCYVDSVEISEDETVKLHIAYDFIIDIVPPKPPAKVDISKVRSLIPWLSQNKGINWGKITYDTFQSEESMQELDKAGFPVDYQSVDKTDEAYLALVDYLYEERVKFPYNAEFEFNLFNVVHFRSKHKVDHTSNGRKDISDSVVGSLFNAIKSNVYQTELVQKDIDIMLDL